MVNRLSPEIIELKNFPSLYALELSLEDIVADIVRLDFMFNKTQDNLETNSDILLAIQSMHDPEQVGTRYGWRGWKRKLAQA